MAYNKVILIGRLVKDAEVKYTNSGKAVATFTLAVDRPSAKGEQKEADFINCVAWDKTGETIGNYTQKGSKILVDGRLQIRSYEAKDGGKRWATEVIVGRMEFLETKNKADDNNSGFSEMGTEVPFNEEIPF